MDYYKVLGVDEKSTQEEIKKAFKSLSKKYHPDKFATKSEQEREDAENKFKEISEAYNILSDENKRKEYDMQRNPMFGFNSFGFNPFSGFSTIIKGENAHAILDITLEDIYNQNDKEVRYVLKDKCPHCNGTGSENGDINICEYCNGSGRYRTERTIGNSVFVSETTCPHCGGNGFRITKKCSYCDGTGVINNEQTTTIKVTPVSYMKGGVVISGLGNKPLDDRMGENGDLIVRFRLLGHEQFQCEKLNLITTLDVNLLEISKGCDKSIKLLNGKELKVTIPPLSKANSIFRVAGKGLTAEGDLFIKINIITPIAKLTKEQEKLLTEFYKIEDKKNK